VAGSSLNADHPDIQDQRPSHIDADKYLRNMEDNIMDEIDQQIDQYD